MLNRSRYKQTGKKTLQKNISSPSTSEHAVFLCMCSLPSPQPPLIQPAGLQASPAPWQPLQLGTFHIWAGPAQRQGSPAPVAYKVREVHELVAKPSLFLLWSGKAACRVIIAFGAQDAVMPAVARLCWGTAREQSQLSSAAWKDIWGHLCDRYCPAGLGIARTYPSAARLPRGSSSAAQGLDGCGENTSVGWVPPARVLLPAAISIPWPAHTRGSLLLSSLAACDGCPLLRPSWDPAEQ